MAKLETIVNYVNQRLSVESVPDYPGALNGLQLQSTSGKVTRIAAAVDASLPVVEAAVAEGADLLVVHHGMFWAGAQPVVDATFEKFRVAIEAGLAVYSVHIPLDVHSTYGNNVLLSRAIGLRNGSPFFPWKGIELGLRFQSSMALASLVDRVEKAVGGPVHVCPAGKAKAGKIGVITGGAGGEIHGVAESGIETFVTGEGPHWSYTAAEELGVNVIYAGHYATETFGVRALAEHLASRFKTDWLFVDRPTGL